MMGLHQMGHGIIKPDQIEDSRFYWEKRLWNSLQFKLPYISLNRCGAKFWGTLQPSHFAFFLTFGGLVTIQSMLKDSCGHGHDERDA
jgi:hypothetical protein